MDNLIFKSFIPEIFLSISILFQLIFNARLINFVKYNFPLIDKEVLSQTFFVLLCILFLFNDLRLESVISNFIFLNDEGNRVVKLILTLCCLFSLIVILRSFNLQNLNFFEFFIIFLLSLFALFLLISSYDLLSAYLIVEMQALCFYVLASFRRNSAFSTEAGLKYFISGSFISGIFLFGCSLVYGGLGTLKFNDLNLLLSFNFESDLTNISFFVLIGLLFITISLLFKVTAAPFHFWAPDVYEGAPLSSTVIFSIFPKLMLFTFFIKWLSVIAIYFFELKFFLLVTGIISIFFGTFFALRQKRLKRLLIYSSIGQVGFLVAALSTGSLSGNSSLYFFLIVYIITSILVWSYLTLFYSFQKKTSLFFNKTLTPLFLSNLSNIFQKNYAWAFSISIIFFSMAGIPPFSGFFSKFFVLFSLIQHDQLLGSTFFVLIGAVSVFYYIRILKTVFFESNTLSSSSIQLGILFESFLFKTECFILSFFLFILIFVFFSPTSLLLLGQYIVLNFFSF